MTRARVRRMAAILSTAGARVREERGRVLAVVALGWLLALGMRLTVPALLPGIKAEFAINNTTAGFAVTLLWITYAAVQFPAGVLTDRSGERRALLWSMLIAGAGVLVFALAPAFGLFLLACVLFGLGTGLIGPPRVTILSRLYPETAGTALGVTFAAGNVGAAALPFLAGLIAVRFGWRAAFAAAVPAFLLVLVAIWRTVPRHTSGTGNAVEGSTRHALGRIRAAVSHRPVVLVGAATTLLVFTYQGFTAFLPTYLVTAKGMGAGTAAALFGAFFAVGAVMQPLAGAAGDRYGDRPVLFAITGFHVLTLVALPFVEGVGALSALVLLMGLRAGLGPINNAYLVAALPDDVRGSGYGLLRTGYMSIGSTGSIAVGALADADLFDGAFFLLAGLTAVAALLYLMLPPRGQ